MTASFHSALPIPRLLWVAKQAALAGGEILAEGYHRPKNIQYKGDINLVTQYDLASERAVTGIIGEAFPDHGILAEESGQSGDEGSFLWLIDPLDGTTNFAHGFPVFCVSIACWGPGPAGPRVLAGVVYDPLRRELFTAGLGHGAFVNDQRLHVSSEIDLGRSLLATGFPYDLRDRAEGLLARFSRLVRTAQGVRRAGAAALDLAWVAAGRLDGYWEEGLWPWDTGAGSLIVEEAGGRVTDFKGTTWDPWKKEVLASNGRIHYNMVEML